MVLVFIPREGEAGETRVAATPDTVKGLIKAGATVAIESGAGDSAGFPDADFREAGADVGAAKWGEADLVLGIRPPAAEQISSMKQGANLICGMQPHLALDQVKACRDNKVTLFSMDVIPRISRAQSMDVLSSQATVAGYMAVLLGAIEMPNFMPQFMTAAGTIRPAKVLVLGAGVAGLQAIATARRLGATVEANDVRPATRDQVESLGGKFVDTGSPPEAQGTGGYAKETSEEYLRKQKEILTAHIEQADVLITTANIPGRKAPLLVDASMRAKMRPGSVIVDLAAPTGGNVEGTKPGEVAVVEGVTILGELNLPSRCAADASRMWSKNVSEFVGLLVADGKIAPNFEDEILAASLITRDGQVAHEGARDALAGGKQS
jgi:NAD(P) transhydrogenase subunit alpha